MPHVLLLCSHLLLQVSGHLYWKTPKNRSIEYVEAICKELGARAKTGVHIKSVKRTVDAAGNESVTVVGVEAGPTVYDKIVFACHPDQALAILGDDATQEEKDVLGCFKYSSNDTYVQTDVSLMPKSRDAWTSWNYIGTSKSDGLKKPVYVSYWLNKLQRLNHPRDIFVSLNPCKLHSLLLPAT